MRRLYLKPSLSPREGRPTVVQSVDWLAERDGRGWLQIVPLRSSRVVTIPEASIGASATRGRACSALPRLVPSRADGRLRSWTVSRATGGLASVLSPVSAGHPPQRGAAQASAVSCGPLEGPANDDDEQPCYDFSFL